MQNNKSLLYDATDLLTQQYYENQVHSNTLRPLPFRKVLKSIFDGLIFYLNEFRSGLIHTYVCLVRDE